MYFRSLSDLKLSYKSDSETVSFQNECSNHASDKHSQSRAQQDITSGSSCPGIFKYPHFRLPVFFLPRLETFNTFKVQEKPLLFLPLFQDGVYCHDMAFVVV